MSTSNCQTGKENYVKSMVDLHKDIRLISPCGGGEDKRCVESTVWKCGSVEVWKWFSGNKKEGKSGGDGNGSSLSTQLWPDDNDVGNKSPTGGQS